MPPNQDDKRPEVETPDSDLIITQNDIESTSSSSEHLPEEEHSIYETIELPQEPTLKELIQKSCNLTDVNEETKVKLMVIAVDVGLQHLNHHVPKLTELILDGSLLVSLRDLGCNLKFLKILRVNRCGLINLDGTCGFDALEELYIAKNKLTDISQCFNLGNLKILDASNNYLQKIDSLYFLSLCENLIDLSLIGNEEIVSNLEYRKIVKELIPQLKVLDGKSFTFDEINSNGKVNNPGSSFLPPLESSKMSPNEILNETSNEISTKILKESSFTIKFSPKVLSANSQKESSSTQRDLLNLSSDRSQNRDLKGRILPGIKKKT